MLAAAAMVRKAWYMVVGGQAPPVRDEMKIPNVQLFFATPHYAAVRVFAKFAIGVKLAKTVAS
jgi:hypothetical protein